MFCQLLGLNVKLKFMFAVNVANFSDMIFHSYDFQLITEQNGVPVHTVKNDGENCLRPDVCT